MSRVRVRSLLSALAIACFAACLLAATARPALGATKIGTSAIAVPTKPQIAQNYGKLPLRFESNRGQADGRVRFLSRGSGYKLYLTGQEAVFALSKPVPSDQPAANAGKTDVLRMRLAGANAASSPTGEDRIAGITNYLLGEDASRWLTNVPNYSRVRYADVYPGVDLVYYGNQQQLEYDFVVAPGADPARIQLKLDGAKRVKLDASGNLVIAAADGEIAFHKPVVYQTAEGRRRPVPGRFTLDRYNTVGFALGSYDRSRPLVIDPTLVYSTFLGGSTSDKLNDIAVDSSGNAYVTGYTTSTDYPVTPGVISGTDAESHSIAFVTKLNASGTALIYSTFLGGTGTNSGGEAGNSIAVDSSGEAFVAGSTYSSNFPVTTGALQITNKATAASGQNGFVSKLNAAGTSLLYSTYLGGSRSDTATSIAIDSSGDAYIAEGAYSNDLPVSATAYQKVNNAYPDYGWNEFVAKLNPAGSALLYATYIGGSDDYGQPDSILVAIDSSGDAFVSGIALSRDFPVTASAYQKTNPAKSGYSAMTLSKLNPGATALLYSTYLGGSGGGPAGGDVANGLAVDSSGDAYLVGTTAETNYPVTSSAYQKTNKGPTNAFITKMNPAGSALVYSTYLGGSGANTGDYGYGIAVDASGDAFVTGMTASEDFPVSSNAYQKTNGAADNYGQNAFLTEFNPAGTSLLYSTYMGGSSYDAGYAIALGSNSTVYIAGQAGEQSFPTTHGAYQTVYKSQFSATGFVAEFTFGTAPTTLPTTTTLTSNANPAVTGMNVTFAASVVPNTGTAIPTGNVVFSIDQKTVATIALNTHGYADYSTTTPLALGQHAILASYAGSSTYSASGGNITENITSATPVLSPASGIYSSAQLVSITDRTPSTTIYYTTDGSTPTAASTKYTAPILVSTSTVIHAVAVVANASNSAIGAASYQVITAPTALAVPATAIATPKATLNGLVSSFGMAGSYYFQYGTSATALTLSTPKTALPGSQFGSHFGFAPVQVSAALTTLTAKTTYYYQVMIVTPAGTSSGQVLHFTTN